ncbi:MAG: hypothetical protein WCD69_06990 [Xanthobacteraceae bacterium]
MPKKSSKSSAPIDPSSAVRALTDEEIERLQDRLGETVDPQYLVHWVSLAIRDAVRVPWLPTARDYRDSLGQIAKEGHQWIDGLNVPPGISVLGLAAKESLEQAADEARSAVAKLCDRADRLADTFGALVKPGRPRTSFALEAFVDRMIGIAKRAKVYPSSEGRALRSHTDPRPAPDFFQFVVEALEIAEEVIRSSRLTEDRKYAALSALAIPSRGSLSKLIERLRGKISDYREGEHGLVNWPEIDPDAD